MILLFSLLAGASLSLVRSQPTAISVNFTTSEGYTNNRLKKQTGWTGSPIGFTVNPSDEGIVSIDDNVPWKTVVYQTPLSGESQAFHVAVEFAYDREKTSSPLSKKRPFIALELNKDQDPKKNAVSLRLYRHNKKAFAYQLVLITQVNGKEKTFFSNKRLKEKLLGFSNANISSSDNLELRLSLSRNVKGSWEASGTVTNKKTNWTLTYSKGSLKIDPSYFSSKLYAAICSTDIASNTLISNRVIESFLVSSTNNGGGMPIPTRPPSGNPDEFPGTSPSSSPGSSTSPSSAPSERKPNVLFFVVDDLNDWTGLWKGHPDALTPNLDRLARMGLRFTNAHCSVPACVPSRAAVLSGMRPSTSGFYDNLQNWAKNPKLDESYSSLLPQVFRDNGYYSAGAGKVFHKGPRPEPFDDFLYNNRAVPKPPASELPLNGLDYGYPDNHFDWGPVNASKPEFADWQTADYAINKLNESPSDKPLFLALGFNKPHLPWFVPQEYFDRFPIEDVDLPVVRADDLDDIPQAGKDIALHLSDHAIVTMKKGEWKRGVQGYLAATAFMDDCLGSILDALDNHPEKDNTILVLWSDHGWHLGEKMHWRKFALWEEATRVPLMMVVPGMTTPDSMSQAPVSLQDIYPTLLDLIGAAASPDGGPQKDGNSLVPLLQDVNATWNHSAITENGFMNRSVRTARWRYILYADGSEELYDHSTDPNEWTNLANQTELDAIKAELALKLPQSYTTPSPR